MGGVCIYSNSPGGNPHGTGVNILDCDIEENGLELQSRYYIHFRTLPSQQKSTIIVLQEWLWY